MPRLATSKLNPLLLVMLLGIIYLYRRSDSNDNVTSSNRYPPLVKLPTADEQNLGSHPPKGRLPLGEKLPPAPKTKNVLAESMPLNRQETLNALQPLLVERPDARFEGYIGGQAAREEADRFISKHNRKVLEGLVDCVFGGTCAHYQSKPFFPSFVTHFNNLTPLISIWMSIVVILDAFIFPHARDLTPKRDDYYAHSALKSLDNLGASYVFSNVNSTWAVEIHKLFPSLVHAVIFQEGDHVYHLKSCFASSDLDKVEEEDEEAVISTIEVGCVKSRRFPQGIPAYKIFGWSNDEFPGSPLGLPWTLVSEPFHGGQTYIGFSIEEQCANKIFPSVPAAARPKDPHHRAFIHANLETYFWTYHNVWKPSWFDRAVAATNVQPYAALDPQTARLKYYESAKGVWVVPKTLVELDRSKMSDKDLLDEMAKASIFVGLWDPRDMVQPYVALCMGVPYLNPINHHDPEHPDDRRAWVAQNTGLKWVDAPYVYNVFKQDEAGFQDALRGSIENTFVSYIPPSMTTTAVRARWAKFLDTDWLEKAELEAPPAELERFGLARRSAAQ